jgi:hypothetical protein
MLRVNIALSALTAAHLCSPLHYHSLEPLVAFWELAGLLWVVPLPSTYLHICVLHLIAVGLCALYWVSGPTALELNPLFHMASSLHLFSVLSLPDSSLCPCPTPQDCIEFLFETGLLHPAWFCTMLHPSLPCISELSCMPVLGTLFLRECMELLFCARPWAASGEEEGLGGLELATTFLHAPIVWHCAVPGAVPGHAHDGCDTFPR